MTSEIRTVGGRDYVFVSPKPMNSLRPLLMVLHGGFGNPTTIENATKLTFAAESEGFFVAFPEGVSTGPGPLLDNRTWNAGICCGKAVEFDIPDVTWLNEVIDDVIAYVPDRVDPDRVYVTGLSNGAMMAYRLVAHLPNKIAGICAVAGTLALPDPVTVLGALDRFIPVLHIHGDADDNVPFLGGVGPSGVDHRPVPTTAGPDSTMSLILAVRGTITTDHDWPSPNVERWRYTCSGGAPVELNLIHGGGHTWPGTPTETLQALNATALLIRWLKPFSKA